MPIFLHTLRLNESFSKQTCDVTIDEIAASSALDSRVNNRSACERYTAYTYIHTYKSTKVYAPVHVGGSKHCSSFEFSFGEQLV